MKIKMIRSTIANGKDLFAGKTYEVEDKVAKYLIQIGKAVAVKNGQAKNSSK